LAAHAQLINNQLTVYALVATPDGQTVLRANARGPIVDPEALGARVAQDLLDQGADKLLAGFHD
jgi:hydroxymethylbilane synthase